MEENSIPQVVKKILPAVVSITVSKNFVVYKQQSSPFFGLENELAVPQRRKKVKVGGGSGFVVDPEGLILTNRHVVADPKAEYLVLLNDNKKFKAKILARDPVNDLAIIRIKAKRLPTLEIGDSEKIELGQTVIAIGNSLGFSNTISSGIVSGLSRELIGGDPASKRKIKMKKLIQTDAAINPGNTGGPLVNLKGEVIGINTAVVFLAENVGFALPINPAKKVISDIKKYGEIKTPFLGVKYIPIDKKLKEGYDLPVGYGVLLAPIELDKPIISGGPADRAGLKEEDIILEAEGEKITTDNSLEEILQKYDIGQEIELVVLRGKKKKKFKIKLGERK